MSSAKRACPKIAEHVTPSRSGRTHVRASSAMQQRASGVACDLKTSPFVRLWMSCAREEALAQRATQKWAMGRQDTRGTDPKRTGSPQLMASACTAESAAPFASMFMTLGYWCHLQVSLVGVQELACVLKHTFLVDRIELDLLCKVGSLRHAPLPEVERQGFAPAGLLQGWAAACTLSGAGSARCN